MTLLVDSSVWSLAFRRDSDGSSAEVLALRQALEGGDLIVTTGLILQELLQGFSGPRASKDLIDRFSALPFLSPDRQDPIDAAELRINAVVQERMPVRSMRYWRSCASATG